MRRMSEASRIGVAEENVVIRAGDCSLTILPRLGGKIGSFKVVGHGSAETEDGAISIPDHGDLWRVEWEPKGSGTDSASVTLCGECFSLPLVLARTFALKKTSRGWKLSLNYKATNSGGQAID